MATLHRGLSDVEYRALPGVRVSTLKAAKYCPNSCRDPIKETANMALGTLIHAMILEPDSVASRYMVWEGRKAAKEKAYQEALAQAGGRIIISPDDYQKAQDATHAVMNSPFAEQLEGAEREVAVTFDVRGLAVKGKIDALAKGMILDVKTTVGAYYKDFGKQAANLFYPMQLAAYALGVEQATGETIEDCLILAIEVGGPTIRLAGYRLEDEQREKGLVDLDDAVLAYQTMEAKGWPVNYTHAWEPLWLPAWA